MPVPQRLHLPTPRGLISPHLRQRTFGAFRSDPQMAHRWLSSGIFALQEWQMISPGKASVFGSRLRGASGVLVIGCCRVWAVFTPSTGVLFSGLMCGLMDIFGGVGVFFDFEWSVDLNFMADMRTPNGIIGDFTGRGSSGCVMSGMSGFDTSGGVAGSAVSTGMAGSGAIVSCTGLSTVTVFSAIALPAPSAAIGKTGGLVIVFSAIALPAPSAAIGATGSVTVAASGAGASSTCSFSVRLM